MQVTNIIFYISRELKQIIMINEWINDGIHPITGLKEYFKAYNPTVGARHDYKYEFENKYLANISIKEQKYA